MLSEDQMAYWKYLSAALRINLCCLCIRDIHICINSEFVKFDIYQILIIVEANMREYIKRYVFLDRKFVSGNSRRKAYSQATLSYRGKRVRGCLMMASSYFHGEPSWNGYGVAISSADL